MKRLLKRALDAERDARNTVWARVQSCYPVGDAIQWLHNDKTQFGTVVGHGWPDRLKVYNTHTQREVRIYAYRIS